MDVKQYYRKLREIEASIPEPFVLITSVETSDGGKPGVISEVSRECAAKFILEGRAVLSDPSEAKIFADKRKADRRAYDKAELARRLQVTIVSAPDTLEMPAEPERPAAAPIKK